MGARRIRMEEDYMEHTGLGVKYICEWRGDRQTEKEREMTKLDSTTVPHPWSFHGIF